VNSRKVPIYTSLRDVTEGVPSGKLAIERLCVRDASVTETLDGKSGEFHFGDVEPTAVDGSVMDLQSLREAKSCFWWERLVKRRGGVRVEIIHDEHNFRRVRVLIVKQPLNLVCPIFSRPVRQCLRMTPTGKRFREQKNAASPVSYIFVVYFDWYPRLYRERTTNVIQ